MPPKVIDLCKPKTVPSNTSLFGSLNEENPIAQPMESCLKNQDKASLLCWNQGSLLKKGGRELKCDFQEHDSVIALISFIWSTNTDVE